MNEQEFEEQLNALHDRVLSKALSDEEKNNYTESLFESIRHVNEYGQEFWYARDLQIALEYTEWRNFCKVIDKAKEACRGSNNAVSDHFVDVNKIVNAGVETTLDYAIFQNYGYMGLYGGLKASDIKERKGLKKSQDILDYMGYEELAANLFRATQTEAKLRRENIQGKQEANKTHFEVGKKVRDTIKDLGGTMPEDLPTPEKSIQQLEREQKKKLK